MAKPSKLLERVGHSIAERILSEFKDAISVQISISKFNPPIGGVCRKASVTISKMR
jgi:7,8-dihydroneopterin aldolase/epimerase/oxygenase